MDPEPNGRPSARTSRPATRYRNVLVALDPYEPVGAVLDRAIAVGLRDRARLTLLSVVPRPSSCVWLAPLLPFDPRRVLESDVEVCLRTAAAAIPRSLSVVAVLGRGSLESALLSELRRDEHDLVVTGLPQRRHLTMATGHRAGWRFLRRSPVPVLLVTHDRRPPPRRTPAATVRIEPVARGA